MSENQSMLTQARDHITRAYFDIDHLHLGPLDHNIFELRSALKAADRLLEEYARLTAKAGSDV